jgi:hypothetical protein
MNEAQVEVICEAFKNNCESIKIFKSESEKQIIIVDNYSDKIILTFTDKWRTGEWEVY